MYHSLLKSKKGKYCVNPSTFEDDILLFLFSDIHFLNIYLHISKRTTHWRTGLLKLNNIPSFKLQNNFKSHLGPVGPCGPAGPVTDGVVTKLTGIKLGLQLLLQQLNMFSPFGDFAHQCILWKKQTKGFCLKFWFFLKIYVNEEQKFFLFNFNLFVCKIFGSDIIKLLIKILIYHFVRWKWIILIKISML